MYADRLIERGSTRGELIQLQLVLRNKRYRPSVTGGSVTVAGASGNAIDGALENEALLLRDLFSTPFPPRIHTVTLAWMALDDKTIAPLVTTPHLARLRSLAFHDCILTDAAMLALVRSPHLPSLRTITVSTLQTQRLAAPTVEECSRRFTVVS